MQLNFTVTDENTIDASIFYRRWSMRSFIAAIEVYKEEKMVENSKKLGLYPSGISGTIEMP